MRRVVEEAGDRSVDTTDGVRVVESDGRWVMVLPDPAEAVTHLWAEGPDDASANALLDEWSEVVESAGSADRGGRTARRCRGQFGVWLAPTCDDVRHAAAATRSEQPRARGCSAAPGRLDVAAHQRHGAQPRRRLRGGRGPPRRGRHSRLPKTLSGRLGLAAGPGARGGRGDPGRGPGAGIRRPPRPRSGRSSSTASRRRPGAPTRCRRASTRCGDTVVRRAAGRAEAAGRRRQPDARSARRGHTRARARA